MVSDADVTAAALVDNATSCDEFQFFGGGLLMPRRSASFSVKVLLESLLEDVLVCPPLGSSQRAKANVCVVIDLERQGDKLLHVVASLASALRPRRAG
jgi:hypothetical protein